MSMTVQQDATIYNFIIFSAYSSTCFGLYLHLSSGAHVNCNYNIWHWSNRICYLPLNPICRLPLIPPRQRKVANTVRPVPDVVITFWVCSWWWVKVSPETRRTVCRNIIKLYIVASCWTIIDTDMCFYFFCNFFVKSLSFYVTRTERDMIVYVYWCSCKVPFILVRI